MSKLKTAISLIRSPGKMIIPMASMGFFNWMPDKPYLKLVYRGEIGKKLNLKNPKTYNEKLQWLKLHDRKPLYRRIVDKYEVKRYVSDIIGEEYIIPTLGVWDTVEEIPFDTLPNQFVLKCTHDSGSVVICKDKNELNIEDAKKKLSRSLKRTIFWFGREWPYKDLKPRIIAEKLLGDGKTPMNDYKVLCFHGEPKLIEVHAGRGTDNHTQDFYTTDWIRTDIEQTCEPMAVEAIPAPIPLKKILELSRLLSKNFIHIRVDWYVEKEKIYFGELTFFDGSGFAKFEDEKWDEMMGDWIRLPEGDL